jgi:hypothetical protein
MKNIFFILLVIVFTIPSCKKEAKLNSIPLDVDKQSIRLGFNSIPIYNNSNIITNISVTVGTKYSVQLTDIFGEVVTSKGGVAASEVESVTIDTKDLKPGMYDIIVVDIKGKEIKQPINIK